MANTETYTLKIKNNSSGAIFYVQCSNTSQGAFYYKNATTYTVLAKRWGWSQDW